MKFENYVNILLLTITLLGFIIGFVNLELRIVVWSISLILIAVLIIFLMFRDYIGKIEDNETSIKQIKKDLNISDRLSKLEGKIEGLVKNGKN